MSCRNKLFKLLNESIDCYSDRSSCTDRGKSFSVYSKTKRFCTIKVDGCLVKLQSTRKCDFLIVECSNPFKFHFIELKGSSISDAAEQIMNTIQIIKQKLLKKNIVLQSKDISIHIVCRLGTKSNQRKDEIVEEFLEKFSVSPRFYTQDTARITL